LISITEVFDSMDQFCGCLVVCTRVQPKQIYQLWR